MREFSNSDMYKDSTISFVPRRFQYVISTGGNRVKDVGIEVDTIRGKLSFSFSPSLVADTEYLSKVAKISSELRSSLIGVVKE